MCVCCILYIIYIQAPRISQMAYFPLEKIPLKNMRINFRNQGKCNLHVCEKVHVCCLPMFDPS